MKDLPVAYPKISVVTPSYNQGRFIREAIESVCGQDYPYIEHIVVDGGSKDETLMILQEYTGKVWWVSEPDRGQSEALNKGLRRATGDIIGVLNSDDMYLEDAIHIAVEALQASPDTDAIFGDYVIIDEKGNSLVRKREIDFDFNILLHGVCYIGHPTVFMRRAVLDAVGMFDESLDYSMDLEYWLRMASHGLKFKYIPQFLAAIRWHLDTKVVKAPKEFQEVGRMLRDRYWEKPKLLPSFLFPPYFRLLNLYYRAKRQGIKLLTRGIIDFPPSHFYLFLTRSRLRR